MHSVFIVMHSMFIAALFTIAKIWKQPKRSMIDEWIKKMWGICIMKYFSHKKSINNFSICDNIDGPRGCYAK